MIGKLFKSKNKAEENTQNDTKELVEKIAKMKLSDMRSYVRNSIKDFEICEQGLLEVMNRLTLEDPQTKKFYINSDDMPTKKKKAFDLVILIAAHRSITLDVVEQIQKFMQTYKEIITAYDKEFKEIYESRLTDALTLAISNLDKISNLENKMRVLGE